jgi:hypothetical protein
MRDVSSRQDMFHFSKKVEPYSEERIGNINSNFLQIPCPDHVIRIRILGDKLIALFVSKEEKFFFPLDT